MDNQNKKSPRKRARKPDGKFKGDNPLTPDVNEAWEPTEIESTLPKKKDYSVKKKVNTLSTNSAGKYHFGKKLRPNLGKCKVISGGKEQK